MKLKFPKPFVIGWVIIISNIIFLMYHFNDINSMPDYLLRLYFSPSAFFGDASENFQRLVIVLIPTIHTLLGIGIIRLNYIARSLFIISQLLNGVVAGFILFFAWGFSGTSLALIVHVFLIMGSYVFYIIYFLAPSVEDQFK